MRAQLPLGRRSALRIVRLPGFFALVVEPLDRRLPRPDTPLDVRVNGFTMRLDLKDYNQRRIYYRAHEPREAKLLRRILHQGDTVQDIGANVGFFTLLAAGAVGARGHVHAFEPIPANRAALETNLRISGITNAVVVGAAVGATTGEVTLGIPEGITADLGSTSAMYTQGVTRKAVRAPTVVLDEYVEHHVGPGRVALVKIDVEGVEPLVLQGFAKTLASRPPDALLVEVNRARLADHGFAMSDVVAPLDSAGYLVRRIDSFGRLRPIDRSRDARRPIFNVFASSSTASRANSR